MEAPLTPSPARHAFFEQEGVDQLVSMVLELATELWVLRERMYAFERVAARHGIPAAAEIEAWRPNDAEQAELAAMRQKMLGELLRTLDRQHRRA
jgi:hypothetical protein